MSNKQRNRRQEPSQESALLGTESNHPTWPFLAAPETPVNTRPSLLKPFSHLHYNGVSTENRMAVFFLFLKSKGREKENTEIFRKQINGPFVFPSRDKRKHHQAAHVEPRTTRSSALWPRQARRLIEHQSRLGTEPAGEPRTSEQAQRMRTEAALAYPTCNHGSSKSL